MRDQLVRGGEPTLQLCLDLGDSLLDDGRIRYSFGTYVVPSPT